MAKVEEGQVYRSNGAFARVWRVVKVYPQTPRAHMPHAHLQCIDDPCEERTLACSVLLDRQHYALVRAESVA